MAKADIYENDGSLSSATTLTVGSVQTHSISRGDEDWVKFTISSAGDYTLQTSSTGDLYIELYDSYATRIAYDDDNGAGYNARISRYFNRGTYYAKIRGYSSTTEVDSYRVALYSGHVDEYENDNSCFGATTLSVGATQHSHSIHAGGDEDWYKFTVNSDGFYSIRITGGDTILQLYSFEGQAFGYNDDRGNGDFGSSGTVQLYAGTSYYVRVTSYASREIPSYSISLSAGVIEDAYESNGEDSIYNAVTLSINSVQTHTIHSSNDTDWVKFVVSEAGYYYLLVGTSERIAGQMQFSLYNSSGYEIDLSEQRSDLCKTSGENPYLGARFGAGTYYVKLSAANPNYAAGEYSVSVSMVSSLNQMPDDEYEDDGDWHHATRLSLGTSLTHSLNVYYGLNSDGEATAFNDEDWFVFTPSSTGMYKISVSGTHNPTRMSVFVADEGGFPLLPWGGSSRINPFAENYMQAGQTYYIHMTADGSRMNVDSYGITIEKTSAYVGERDNYELDDSPENASVIRVDQAQAHSIHSVADSDWMKFTPSVSGWYTFYTGARNGNAGDADMMIGLYDSNGMLLIYDDDSFSAYNAMMSYNLVAGQTYYLVALSARSNAVVPYYTVSVMQGIMEDTYDIYMDERSKTDDTRENAIKISVGETQSHTIHDSDDVDWVGFYVENSGDYVLQTTGSGDTLIYIYDENGSYIRHDDDSGIGRNASIRMRLEANTVYYARVSAYGQELVPHYGLSLTELSTCGGDAYESDDTRETARGIVAGETQSRSISAPGDVDWVVLRPIQSGAYQIQTTGNGDMKLDLYNASGVLLASDDDSGTGLNARIGYTLSANTAYYIRAYAYDALATIDSYALNVSLLQTSNLGDEFEADNTPALAKPIFLGQTQTHSIHASDDADWVTFTPTVNAEYTIQTIGSGLNCDTLLHIYDSLAHAQDGTVLQWDDDSGTDRNALITRILNAGTTYYIRATAYSTYTIPSYGLRISQVNGQGAESSINGDVYESDNLSGNCKPIAVGREYTHSIHTRSDTDWIRFFTHQTGSYTIQTTGEANMSMIVYKRIPGGRLVPYAADGNLDYYGSGEEISYGGAAMNPLLRVDLETDNWYYVRITTENRSTLTTNYGVRVDIDSSSVRGDAYENSGGKANDNAPSRATWVTLGSTQVHSIHAPGDQDWYVYKASGSSQIVFSAENDESVEMRLFLYRKQADGSLSFITQSIVGSYGYTSVQLNSDSNAIYYLRAQALSPTKTVSGYRLGAVYVRDSYEDDDTSAHATQLLVGHGQTHNIHSQTDVDWFKFEVSSAGTYEFETSGGGDTYGILYQSMSSGNTPLIQAGSGGEGGNFRITRYLSVGTYYLRVSGERSKLVENYEINARRPIIQYDEPNDSRNSATALTVNASKTGSFHSATDIDYYRISNAVSGTYHIAADTSSVRLTVYSGNSSNAIASGSGSVDVHISGAGTLYVKAEDANASLVDSYAVRATYSAPVPTNSAENYVVLFAGGAGLSSNRPRYYYNFRSVYEALVENYDIPRNHIYVLYADGTSSNADYMLNGASYNSNMSYANGSHVYSASKSNFTSVMRSLAEVADSNDHLLVYVYDHGSGEEDDRNRRGEERICTWDFYSDGGISGSEYNNLMRSVGAGYQTHLFAQCFAGGILDALDMSSGSKRVYGAASDTHYSPAISRVNTSTGVGNGGFAYEVLQAFSDGVNNTGNLAQYVITNNYSRQQGFDAPYERGNTNFQIFAQA